MWLARDSQGRMVPSVSDLDVGQRARRCPLSGQSGWWARIIRLEARRRGCRASCGGARAASQVGQSAKRLASSMVPPSTRTTPPVASGWRTASSRATLAPQLWPATQGSRSVPPAESVEHGHQVVGQGGEVVAVVGFVRLAVAALVDRGDRVARRAASRAATPSHSRALDASPCTSSTGVAGAVESAW